MVRYREWADGRRASGGASGGGEWEARGRLKPLLRLFELAMDPSSASHRSKHT